VQLSDHERLLNASDKLPLRELVAPADEDVLTDRENDCKTDRLPLRELVAPADEDVLTDRENDCKTDRLIVYETDKVHGELLLLEPFTLKVRENVTPTLTLCENDGSVVTDALWGLERDALRAAGGVGSVGMGVGAIVVVVVVAVDDGASVVVVATVDVGAADVVVVATVDVGAADVVVVATVDVGAAVAVVGGASLYGRSAPRNGTHDAFPIPVAHAQ
jgi:hypothetical protein